MNEDYPFKCDICGRPLKRKIKAYGVTYCDKHYKQMKKYGHPLDTNPRTVFDRNEYRIENGVAYIDLYDHDCNKIAETMIDAEDIDKVKYIKWKLSSSGYVMNTPKFKQSSIHMSRVILDTDQMVDHINHNTLDNRKSNLRIVNKSQNQMNGFYRGVDKHGDRYNARIKINGKAINLGTYVFEEEAYYARWYAETILFKQYMNQQKPIPVSLDFRAKQIREYVERKLQRL